MRTAFAATLATVTSLAAFLTDARSQCATQWLSGPPLAGCDLVVNAVAEWDPDGVGPRTPVVVLGGGFTTAGNVPANRVVAFDPANATWSLLGSGVAGNLGPVSAQVRALAVLPNGDLVAGGVFTTAGGGPANCIARWDGVAWSPLGSGMNGDVRALCVLPNGDLVAGGYFTTAGGVPANKIARWNGVAWSGLAGGPGAGAGNAVLGLTVLPSGELIAAGILTPAGGANSIAVARWNGSAWSPVGTGLVGTSWGIVTLPNGDLVTGGSFLLGGGPAVHGVVRWNGTAWSPFGAGAPTGVQGIGRLANGDVVAVGQSDIQRGNGSSWATIGTPDSFGYGLAATQLASGVLIVGGSLRAIDGVPLFSVGAWDGTTWSQLGAPAQVGTTTAATVAANGDVVVASDSGASFASRVLRWNGTSWSQLGGQFSSYVDCLATAANGDILAAGAFAAIGGVPFSRIARWNGTAWQPLGSGIDLWVNTVLELPNGDVVAGGAFSSAGGVPAPGIARWNGTTWAPIGTGLVGETFALALAANGDLLAGCTGPSRVMRWNGTVWSGVGALAGQVLALAELPNGDLVAGGTALFSGGSLNNIARWNGTAWLPLGSGLGAGFGVSQVRVVDVAVLPDGDVVASGTFATAGGAPARGAARWDGTSWTPLATVSTGFPQTMVRAPNGDLVMSGVMRMDDSVSAGFARLTTSCPATANVTGPGCAGDTLAATSLPWTGSVFHARASGLPAVAVALDVLGFATVSIPLAAVLPQAGAGCALAVSPDVVHTLVPSGGVATTQLVIPNSVVLAGTVVHEQVLALGLGAGGAITSFTGTNRLTLTVGSF